jgi:hypothetical protein
LFEIALGRRPRKAAESAEFLGFESMITLGKMITLRLTLQWGEADHVKPKPNLENFVTLLPA